MGEKHDLEGVRPIVKLSRTIYQKGISLSKKAMREIEADWNATHSAKWTF